MKCKLFALLLAGLLGACQTHKSPISGDDALLLSQTAALTSDCSQTSTGRIPLNDLGAGAYFGYQGGLYPGGSNVMPVAHQNLGVSLAAQIQPLDANGAPDALNGKIVLISVGFSNVRNEFSGQAINGGPVVYPSAFKPMADVDPAKNPKLVIVNGAQGGAAIADWLNPSAATWNGVDNLLQTAGVGPNQVQAAWVKMAERDPTEPFPNDQLIFKNDLEVVIRNLKLRYPNIKLAYLSSRIYGAYGPGSNNPEPYAYQSAFGVKWTIEDQINGVGNLNPDPAQGPVVAPWIAWGPYVWADGVVSRSDGLDWQCSDFETDGTHPNNSGVQKVASRLLTHFKTDLTACSWFLANGCGTAPAIAFDAASNNDTGSKTANALSWSHTISSSGSNRILLVAVAIRNASSQTVSTVTCGGSNLTRINSATQGTTMRVELWSLANPPTGTKTIVATLAGSAKARFCAGAVSYTGVNQTAPLGTSAIATASSATSISVNVASAPGELVVDAVGKSYSSESIIPGANQAQRWNDQTTASSAKDNTVGGGSQEAGAATISMSWSASTARAWAIVAVPLRPAL